jgi:integrase
MPKRRGRGEGGIRQRPDGRWEATLDLGWKSGKRVRRYFYGRTRSEAAEKLRKAQAKNDRGLPVGDNRTTVATQLERWLTLQRRSGKAANTIAQYEWAIRNHLVPALGHKRLVDLTADDVDDLLAERAAAGAARNSLMRLRSVLSQALDHAVRRDLVARNVATFTETPAGPARPGRSLTVEEARALLDEIAGDRLEAAYICLLMLGLRPGEVLGLHWPDVDLDVGQVRIRQALKLEDGALVVGPLKTPRSRRTLSGPAPVVEALRTHRRRQLEERMAAGPAWQESELVFTTQIGTPLHPRNFRRRFGQITERAGLGPWRPNELRHSAVSLLSAAGVRLEDVADVVGHVTTRMTSQVYRHQVTPTISAGKEAMERLFGRSGGQFGGQPPSGEAAGGPGEE